MTEAEVVALKDQLIEALEQKVEQLQAELNLTTEERDKYTTSGAEGIRRLEEQLKVEQEKLHLCDEAYTQTAKQLQVLQGKWADLKAFMATLEE